MRHSLKRDDFLETNGLLGKEYVGGYDWIVSPEYELVEVVDPFGGVREHEYAPYIVRPKGSRDERIQSLKSCRVYRPLETEPDLFLKFAHLYRKGFSTKRVLDWVHRYGILGFNNFPQPGAMKEETLRSFWGEVSCAAGVLAMYEAIMNKDAKKAQDLVEEDFYFLTPEYQSTTVRLKRAAENLTEAGNRRVTLWEKIDEEVEKTASVVKEQFGGDYLAYVLEIVVSKVSGMVSQFCRPPILSLAGPPTSDPSHIEEMWGFDNLLGAMYLQMHWLILAGADVTRCKYCGRIISFASPRPGARKRRSDAKFCDKSCQQNYDYHTKQKPKRQSQRKGRE